MQLAEILAHVAKLRPRPKLEIDAAWHEGKLRLRAKVREHRPAQESRLPPQVLMPGEAPPNVTVTHIAGIAEGPYPASILAPPAIVPAAPNRFFSHALDWENSYQSFHDRQTGSLYEWIDIEGDRQSVLTLWPDGRQGELVRPRGVSDLVWAVVVALENLGRDDPTFCALLQPDKLKRVRDHLKRKSLSLRTLVSATTVHRRARRRRA
jgi:hypothetical protein